MAFLAPILFSIGLAAASDPEDEKKASEVVEKFKAAFKSARNEMDQAEAVRILGGFPHRRTMLPLSALTADPGRPYPVRGAAIEVLGTFRGVPGSSKTLVAVALENEKKRTDARRAACRALGELRADDAIGPLQGLIGSKPYDVAREAVIALGKIRNRNSIPVLVEHLKGVEKSSSNEANPLGDVPVGQVTGGSRFPGLGAVAGLLDMAAVGGTDEQQEERRLMLQEPINKALEAITREKWTTAKEWSIWWAKNQASFVVQK